VDRGIDGGQPLRIRFGEHVNMLAGRVMFLEPGAAYKLELCAQDPDGNVALRTVTISTRPRPSSGARLPTLHVAPGTGGGDGTEASPFRGIEAAQKTARPGDTFLLHKTRHEI